MTTPRVRVGALFDALSQNTGDHAIGLAVQQELSRHSIVDVDVLDPFAPPPDPADRLVVVGGGDLIRPVGDRFYDRFRLKGPAVLNSVGVWPDADRLDYLREYSYVSARTSREAEILSAAAPDVQVLPCTTTTMESPDYEIPGLDDDGLLVGIHVVPHTLDSCPELVEAVNAIPHRKVFIPFTHYNNDDTFMRELPFDRTRAIDLPRLEPLELHAVIRQMSYLVVSSLHATIFAYSQGIPFATVAQRKVSDYLDDRRLTDLVFDSTAQLRDIIDRLEQEPPSFADLVAKDRATVHEAFSRFADLARTLPGQGGGESATAPGHLEPDLELLNAQQAEVIAGRDRTIGLVTRRSSAQAALVHQHEADIARTQAALAEARQRIAEAEAEQRRLMQEFRVLRHAGKAAKGLVRRVFRRARRTGTARPTQAGPRTSGHRT